MQKLLLLLGCTTLIFAGAAVALWRQFDMQRDELAAAHARIRELERAAPVRSATSQGRAARWRT